MSAMDPNQMLLEMMRQGFANLNQSIATLNETTNRSLEALNKTMVDHVAKDEKYWSRLDRQSGQISLIKYVGGSGLFALGVDRLLSFFSKH